MADSAISQLTLAASGLAADEFAIGEAGASKKITLSQIADFVNSSGILISLASNETPSSATAMVRVSGIDVANVDAGIYTFEYYIRAQFAGANQSIKFAVNHTGTTTSFSYSFQYPGTFSSTATGAIDQVVNATTGAVWCQQSTRIKNTTLGPETNVDTIDSDILFRISGMAVVTVSGTLELYYGAESAAQGNITIMAGTCLILKKVG